MEVTPGLGWTDSPQSDEPHHHRKRRKRMSWGAVALLGILVAGGLSVPLVHLIRPRYAVPAPSTVPRREEKTKSGETEKRAEPLALTLSDARFQDEGTRRRIVGDVTNGSMRRVTNVVITLNLHIDSDSTAGLAVARVPAIDPGSTAHFQTDPIPIPIRRFIVRSIDAERQ